MTRFIVCALFVALLLGCGTRPASTSSAVNSTVQLMYTDKASGSSVSYKPAGEENIQLILRDVPSYVHPLEMAPKEAEKQIQTGRWLILTFAVWSVPDIQCIGDALREARKHEGKIQLGLRPFSDSKEMRAWIPGYVDSGESPVWTVLEDGKVIAVVAGKLSNKDLEALTRPQAR